MLAFALDLVRDGPVTALHDHEGEGASAKAQLAKIAAALPGAEWVWVMARTGAICDLLRAKLAARLPDVLVPGTRGLRGMERSFRGSVALNMLGEAPCDVVAVPGG